MRATARATHAAQKVLVFRSNLLGYSETFIREQVRHLTTWRGVLVGERRVSDGLDLAGMDVRLIGGRGWLWNLQRRGHRYFGSAPSRIVKLIERERSSLMHVHFGTDAVKIWPVARVLDLPVVVTLHGFDINVYPDWWHAGRGGRWMKRYPERLLALAAEPKVHFAAVSEAVRQQAIEYGIRPDKITVSYIGVDTMHFRPSGRPLAERTDVLFIGRMIEKKGCRYLIEAFASVQARCPRAKLVLVGDGPLLAELSSLAASLNVRASFVGALPANRIRDRIAEARVVCLPSIRADNGDAEGLGIVILEAQACGVPVVTSARGGATEGIVSGKSGYAHPEKDVACMADALQALLTDDELVESFGRCGRAHAEVEFDIRSCTRRLESLYSRHCA